MESTVKSDDYFTPKVLKKIFEHVDLRTLVFTCRLVCRSWKVAVESSNLWETKVLLEHGKKVATHVSSVGYPWYICYALCRGVFNTNLSAFSKGSPSYWKDAHAKGLICLAPIDACANGFMPLPQEIPNDRENKSFLCAFGECRINHSIDLYALGLTRKIMEFQPPIHIQEWYGANYDITATCHIEIKLFSSEWECDTENGYFKYQHRMERREWHKVTHTFTNYSPDVRYVLIHRGIDTRLPHFYEKFKKFQSRSGAAKIVGTKLSVGLPDLSGPPSSSASTN